MKRLLFICIGNINRSPVAKIVMDHISNDIISESRALSDKNKGRLMTKKMREILIKKGYSFTPIRSKPISIEDISSSDMVLYMDNSNLKKLISYFGFSDKYVPLFLYSSTYINKIIDPNFSRGTDVHEFVVEQIEDCCTNLWRSLNEDSIHKIQ